MTTVIEGQPATMIGIHVHAEPQRLHATLASVRANAEAAVLLLPDGPDEPTQAALRGRRGCRLTRLENPGVFVYVRHGRNAWPFELGRFLDPRGWEVVAGPLSLPSEALDAYRAAAATGCTA